MGIRIRWFFGDLKSHEDETWIFQPIFLELEDKCESKKLQINVGVDVKVVLDSRKLHSKIDPIRVRLTQKLVALRIAP